MLLGYCTVLNNTYSIILHSMTVYYALKCTLAFNKGPIKLNLIVGFKQVLKTEL